MMTILPVDFLLFVDAVLHEHTDDECSSVEMLVQFLMNILMTRRSCRYVSAVSVEHLDDKMLVQFLTLNIPDDDLLLVIYVGAVHGESPGDVVLCLHYNYDAFL